MRPISIVVACDIQCGFAKGNTIPWSNEPFFKEDLAHFKNITNGHVCIIGRKTYDDILERRGEPVNGSSILPGRDCLILSRNTAFTPKGATLHPTFRQAVDSADSGKQIYVIGGESVFIEALPWTTRIYMTFIWQDYNCDKFFPLKYMIEHFTLRSGEMFAEKHKFLMYERTKQ